MQKQTPRSELYGKNLKAAIFCHFITLVFGFLTRSVFLKILGKEFLGLTGLFSNVLSTVSVLELGFGQAVLQTLYEPLANKDADSLSRALCFFKKTYSAPGLLIFAAALAMTPFLGFFSKNKLEAQNIGILYFLFVLASVLPFFYTAERCLIICDQKMYAVSIIKGLFCCATATVQVAFLIFFRDYFSRENALAICFALTAAFTLAENIAYKRYAQKHYKGLFSAGKPDKSYYLKVKRNMLGMLYQKIGGIVYANTDNILIAKLLGLEYTALFANYALIIGSVNTVIGLILEAASAGVGNLVCEKDSLHSERVFRIVYFANLWLDTVAFSVLFCCVNPIITVWLGSEMLLSKKSVDVILLYYFFANLRDPSLIFRNAYGLFYEERKKPIVQAVLNLILSVVFIKLYGFTGVFLSELITMLAVCVWYEPYVLYKHGFGMRITHFARCAVPRIVFSLLLIFASEVLFGRETVKSPLEVILRASSVFTVINLLFYVAFGKTNEGKAVIKFASTKLFGAFCKSQKYKN